MIPSRDFVSFVVHELGRPRINQRNRDIIKVRRIARCQRGVLGERDTGNHCIPQFTGTAFPVPRYH